ncbi:orotidine-5'-phosphate decarboxylase [Nonomuraea pusilla]|uniref:orotidine-5'-phosphate decarboxylase n=1 Tax=Nonomuraea pusilla TaxID=46177 RepID=UPI00331D69AC
MDESFGRRLRDRLGKHGPLCAGLEPAPALLSAWGLDDSPAGLERFSRTVIDAVGDVAAVVKPHAAYYERWGSRGLAVLERAVAGLRECGALVVLDAGRGGAGGAMAAYAEAYLDRGSPLAADAVTLIPYPGFASLAGAITSAVANDAGVFVLTRTAAPRTAGQVAAGAAAANAGHVPWGPVGLVLDAGLTALPTPPAKEQAGGLAEALGGLNGPVLAPGLGGPGAAPRDLARRFAPLRHALLPCVSAPVLADPRLLRPRFLRLRDECASLFAVSH